MLGFRGPGTGPFDALLCIAVKILGGLESKCVFKVAPMVPKVEVNVMHLLTTHEPPSPNPMHPT